MARIGFCGPSYQSLSLNADCQTCLNWIPERVESDAGKSQVVLYPRMGLSIYATGAGKGRFACAEINGRAFCVIGIAFYEINANSTLTNRGAVATDGLPASIAVSDTQVLIASGGTCYVFTLATNVLAAVNVNGAVIKQVGLVGGFFLALVANSKNLQISAAGDATTWPGAQVVIPSTFFGNITGMIIDHNEVWLQGNKQSQVYYLSGSINIFDPVLPGGFIEQGAGATFGGLKADNTIFWLMQDERGNRMIYKANGYTPVRVSDHGVEQLLATYGKVSDCVAWAEQWHGHTLCKWYFPTPSKTWVFDVATGWWHEEGFLEKDGSVTGHRAQGHVFVFDKHLVLDWNTGNVYQESDAALDDFGNPIRFLRRAPHISVEKEYIYIKRIEFDVEAGGPQKALTKTSDDQPALIMQDVNGVLWKVTIADNGTINSTNVGVVGKAQPVVLNDQATNTTTWRIGISTLGALTATAQAFNYTLPGRFGMASSGTALQTGLSVSNVGAIASIVPYQLSRGPVLNFRWSKDGGHNYSNSYALDCGGPGDYKKRAIFRRLGRALDFIIEASTTDYLRVIDAYIKSDPDFTPKKRLSAELRERA